MSQENVEAVGGLLAHWATRFALPLSLLAFGALGPVACDDDDETATAEAEVITSDFGQDPRGRGPLAVAGGPDACGDFRTGPGRVSDRGVQRRRSLSRGAARTEELLPARQEHTSLVLRGLRERGGVHPTGRSRVPRNRRLPRRQPSRCPGCLSRVARAGHARPPRRRSQRAARTQVLRSPPDARRLSRPPGRGDQGQSPVSRRAPRAEDPGPRRQSGRPHRSRCPLGVRRTGESCRVP